MLRCIPSLAADGRQQESGLSRGIGWSLQRNMTKQGIWGWGWMGLEWDGNWTGCMDE